MNDQAGILLVSPEQGRMRWRHWLLSVVLGAPLLALANPVAQVNVEAEQQAPQVAETAADDQQMPETIRQQEASVRELEMARVTLDERLTLERSQLDAVRVRILDNKKNVRQEMEDVLQNSSPRERLDSLLQQHETLQADEQELVASMEATREELAAGILTLQQARRELSRLKKDYAARQRELAIIRVQEVGRLLEQDISFSESLTFKCPTTRSLQACLTEKPLDASVQGWVKTRYQSLLQKELDGKAELLELNSDWYDTRVTHEFVNASINLDGQVEASLNVRAKVTPRKMMPCALLGAPADLCDNRTLSLVVRSNKFGDNVIVNQKPYGPTPLSLMLDPGVYHVEVQYQGQTQKRTLSLEDNRHLNFVF